LFTLVYRVVVAEAFWGNTGSFCISSNCYRYCAYTEVAPQFWFNNWICRQKKSVFRRCIRWAPKVHDSDHVTYARLE